jgi:syntaxin 1B/2/3
MMCVDVSSYSTVPSHTHAQMSILVEQQDETIDVIEDTAGHVEKDTEAGLGHTVKAVESARGARRKRWICFGLIVLLLVIIAIVVAIEVVTNRKSE